MNLAIKKLSAIIIVMFVTLMSAVTYIQFFAAPSLNADARNVRTLWREYGTDRGPIIVAGQPVVTSEAYNDEYKFLRTYHQPELYAAITGYFSTTFNSMTGLEREENSVLGGSDSTLFTQRIEQLITGRQPQGGAVSLTIDPQVQQAAWDALGDQRGAVVAIEPATGKILALVSKPTYDPNLLAARDGASANDSWNNLNNDPRRPLINRALGGDLYPPGSVFKIVTAAAMIENLGLTADSLVDAPASFTPPGTTHEIFNPYKQQCGDGSGQVPFATAVAESCNTPFAIGGTQVGAEKMVAMATAFGFNQDLTVPLAVTPSKFPYPDDTAALAMDSFGQRDVNVSPLQMAMVSAAVANHGTLMKPYLVDQTMTADLGVLSETQPTQFSTPISSTTADILRSMMIGVVNNGTGANAGLSNVQIAGKTGTAEIGSDGEAHAWFIGFDATESPKVALAVLVESGQSGAKVAAPIAKEVFNAVVNRD
ncbi:penicillin-binding transpeptidase domain-containing protein [Arcanobacterium buesumense]|uniref:Penicillin-binding protein n=1 Tax=Arcanobacterium buesumense TaxID=2722751 RepID=A0A6H2EJJ8_9ACTO|nr:penicillin-binding transpeptidase domain-containing protein [Arcanobacterium buesumense]QJC21143.1 penicillin-binding protein [Arcanobacterium buesumense]